MESENTDVTQETGEVEQTQNNEVITEENSSVEVEESTEQPSQEQPSQEQPSEEQPSQEQPSEVFQNENQNQNNVGDEEQANSTDVQEGETTGDGETTGEASGQGDTTEEGQTTADEVKTGGDEVNEETNQPDVPATVEEGGDKPEDDSSAQQTKEGESEAAPVKSEGEATEGQAEDTEPTVEESGEEEKPVTEGENEESGQGVDRDAEMAAIPEGESEGVTDTEETKPQSDTFDEGERAESPLAVGEKLSREGSPVDELDIDDMHEMLDPSTPEQVSEAGDEVSPHELMEIVEDEPEIDRAQLIERYHAAIAERDQLQQQNYQLQHKIAEYFKKKKSDETRQDFDKNVSDQEQRYIKYMANLEELRKQESMETDNYETQIEELKERCLEKQEKVEGERQRFADFKKQEALNSLNSRSGKTIPPKDIEQYLAMENRKDNDVMNVRLENIKLKNKLKKKEQQLKSKEELAEGLHLIDFEQLKIENQTYNEKIEERNEELLKLRKKITSTVQVLTHLKEKLQFVQAQNQVQNTQLRDVESIAAQKRDILSRTKQARDALRIDNQKLRQNCGLLGNEPLLRDFEDQRDESDSLKVKLERLRMQHAELTLNCNQVRRKIEQARMNQM